MQAKEIQRFQLPPIDCSPYGEPSSLSRQIENPLPIPALDSPAAQSLESDTPPHHKWLSYSGTAAGAALVVTSGAALLSHTPVYEGQFTLSVDSPTVQTASPHRDTPSTLPGRPTVAVMPEIDRATVSQILESPKVLAPVLDRLKAEHRSLSYETLTHNLTVQVQPHHLEVRYQDEDPERLKIVLQALSQIYIQYGQDCQSRLCRGLSYVEARLPEVQQEVDRLRIAIQQLQQQHNLSNLDVQVRWFSKRSDEIAKQALTVKLDRIKAQNQYASLHQQLRLNAKDSIATRFLLQDSRYLPLLAQLRQIDRQMAQELTSLSPNASQLQTLTQQYQLLRAHLERISQTVLPAYLNNPSANVQDPILQNPATLGLLQQAIGTIHHLQILQVRQETIEFAQQQINVRSQELATLMRQHDQLQQEYTVQTQILQQYLQQKESLAVVASLQQNWKLVAPPEITRNPIAAMERSISWQEATGILVLGAVALGVGIAAEKIRQQETRRWQEHLEILVEA